MRSVGEKKKKTTKKKKNENYWQFYKINDTFLCKVDYSKMDLCVIEMRRG